MFGTRTLQFARYRAFQSLLVQVTEMVFIDLTRIRLQRANYFCLHRGQFAGTHWKVASRRAGIGREIRGDHRWQSQQSRLELGLGFSSGSPRANDLDCGRAWLRKAFHRACRWIADCFCGIRKGSLYPPIDWANLEVTGVVAEWGEAAALAYISLCMG